MLRVSCLLRGRLSAAHVAFRVLATLVPPTLIVGCQLVTDPQSAPSTGSNDSEALAVAGNHALGFMQDFVHVPDHADLDLQHTWTLEAWVYPRAAGNGADEDLISKWAGVTDAAYILQIDGATGRLRLVTNNGVTQRIILSNTRLTNRVWQHVAATFKTGVVRLYLNGVLDRTATGVLTPINSSQPLAFGREGNFAGGTLDGRLDEVRIWKVVRTANQIANWRRRRLTGAETGLVGYWRFDEGQGQVATDATGGGHDGRLGESTDADAWDPRWTAVGAPLR